MKIRTLMLGACLAVFVAPAGAEVYKWTDEEGKIHYGDRKPADRVTQEINIRSGQPSSPSKMAPDPQAEESPANDDTTEDAEAKNGLSDEQRQSNCDIAKKNLKTIEENARIRVQDGDELRYMTTEEIEANRKKMQELAQRDCGPRPNPE